MPSETSLARPRPRPLVRTTLVALVAAVVTACGSAATPAPTPADASALLSAMVASLGTVKQLDAHLTLAGTLVSRPDGVTGSGARDTATPVTLDGTVVDLKSDSIAGSADISITLPAAVGGGGTAEVIVVSKDVYLKLGPLSALMGAADDGKYHHTTTATLAGLGGLAGLPSASAAATASAMPSQLAQALDELRTFFAGLAQAPTIAAVTCGSTMCWDLHLVLGPADLARLAAQGAEVMPSSNPLAGGAMGAASSFQSVSVDVLSRQADSRPAEVKTTVDAGTTGTATADLTITFDQALTISPPAADQVVEGLPLFALP